MRIKEINVVLARENQEARDIHHFFLPLESFPQAEPIYPVKWFKKEELEQFRVDNPFPEAICFIETGPDVLAVAAMDGEVMMGMAGVSEDLWQIGITVKEEYRGKGIAANLVTLLKDEVICRGKVLYYGTGESHNLSNGVAIKAGFFPVWTEMISGTIG